MRRVDFARIPFSCVEILLKVGTCTKQNGEVAGDSTVGLTGASAL